MLKLIKINDGWLPPGFKTWGKVLMSIERVEFSEFIEIQVGETLYLYKYSYVLEQRIKEIERAAQSIDAKYPGHSEIFNLLMLIKHGIIR